MRIGRRCFGGLVVRFFIPEHELVEPVGGGCVHARDDVLVGVGGERVRVVAEPFLDDLDVDAALAETGSVAWVWRRSCMGRIRGRPLAITSSRSVVDTWSGCHGSPS